MSSVLRFLKQVPADTQYFISLLPQQNLNVWNPDAAASTTSYVSGAAAGYFTGSNVPTIQVFDSSAADASGLSGLVIFRDMGHTIISSGRTFRRVQALLDDGNGATGWSSSNTTAGVWRAGNNGVFGTANTANTQDTSFGVFYFETGARGLGAAQGLIRYG
jgi:hypothetical protein